jgi:hypothetical protein
MTPTFIGAEVPSGTRPTLVLTLKATARKSAMGKVKWFVGGLVVGAVLAGPAGLTAQGVNWWQSGANLMSNTYTPAFRLGYAAGAADMLAVATNAAEDQTLTKSVLQRGCRSQMTV